MYGLVAYGAAPLTQLLTQQGTLPTAPHTLLLLGVGAVSPLSIAALAAAKALLDNPPIQRRALLLGRVTPR